MKKETDNLVKKVAAMGDEMSQLTVDKINEMAPEADEHELKLTAKQKAATED